MFFREEEFSLEISMGREYYNNDTRYTILYYPVDVINSKSHKLYGETPPEQKQFLTSKELTIMPNFSGARSENMSEGGIVRQDVDSFNFSVYIQELEDKSVKLKRGDFFSYDHGDRKRFYEVSDINFVQDIGQNMVGQKPYYYSIKAVPAKKDAVNLPD